jgi:uncharacterized protein YacL
MSYKIIATIVVTLIIGVIALYALEFQRFENTVDVNDLLWKSILAGGFAGAVLGFRLSEITKEPVEKMQIWVACLLLPALFSPLLWSLGNRLLSKEVVETKMVFFEEKPRYVSRFGVVKGEKPTPTDWYLFVQYEGNIERFKYENQRFEGVRRGDTIMLKLRRGLLGYDLAEF